MIKDNDNFKSSDIDINTPNEFAKIIFYPEDGKPSENITPIKNETNKSIDDSYNRYVNVRGRPPKNCEDKLNKTEFKNNNFIHEEFLYNKKNIFKPHHYNTCSNKTLIKLYYELLGTEPKVTAAPLYTKNEIINGIHNDSDGKKETDGIIDLQKKMNNLNSKTVESLKTTDKSSPPPISTINLKSMESDSISKKPIESYSNTNIDDAIINNKNKEKIPSLIINNNNNPNEFKNYNEYLFNLEKKSFENNKTDNEYDFLYPDLDDPTFNLKIAKRKEFNDYQYDGSTYDLKTQSNLLCNSEFELMPHQTFVKNFLSSQTPYNSLLLFHGVGTGKTCSAIGISEETRKYMKNNTSKTSQIIIVASPNVQDNFRLQLFDKSKLSQNNGTWNLNTCVGNSLLSEINPTNSKNLTEKQIIKQINNLISSNYLFMGYIEFANFISKLINVDSDSGYSKKQTHQIKINLIQKYFNDRLIIIDEVHNIRSTDENLQQKRTTNLLMEIAKYSDNLKLLLLSATPMYNSFKEIIWLTNVMNINDKRSIIKQTDVFNDDGTFIENSDETAESGKELLQRKLNGFVSYVSGENPYSFPYRIYPDDFSPDNMYSTNDKPNTQLNDKLINPDIKLPLYMVNLNDYQLHGYNCIIQNLKNFTVEEKMPNFNNMESFGYRVLQKPLESLNIVYPKKQLDSIIDQDVINIDKNLLKSAISNTEGKIDIVGQSGLRRIMQFETRSGNIVQNSKPLKFNYQYKNDILNSYGRIFSMNNIKKYSSKIYNICNNILNSKGIVLIYSQFIEGGVVPIALALEELGFSRFSSSPNSTSLFKEPPTEPIDSIYMKTKKELKNVKFNPARYVLITGDQHFSHNNLEDINFITKNENKDGSQVKVIIISRAASEGLDFKNIRQLHVLEPWYNLNRTEQIIGRAVRNLSHCKLPFEERNVEIYLYSMRPIQKSDNSKVETVDMYVYRLAEKKSQQIGNVTRLLKNISIDCYLNISQTNFSIENFKKLTNDNNIVNIQLSSNKTITYTVGDKPFSQACDYMDNCNYTCPTDDVIQPADIITNSYNEFFVSSNYDMISKRIKQIFKDKAFFNKEKLIEQINLNKKYPREQILFILTLFINNIEIIDNFGRRGSIQNVGDFYIFQPIEINDPIASSFERTNPLDYKPHSVLIDLPNNENITKTNEDNDNLPISIDYSSLLDNIRKIVNDSVNENIPTHKIKADSDWYTEIKSTELKFFLFKKHNIPLDHFKKFIIFHFIDTLPLSSRLLLLNEIYNKTDNLDFVENQIKIYFEKLIVYKNNKDFAIVLKNDVDNNTNQLFTLNENNTFSIADEIDSREYFPFIFQNLGVLRDDMHHSIGFMHKFKNENIVFKLKEFSSKYNNKGSYCKNATKEDTIRKLYCLLNISNCPNNNDTEEDNDNTYYYTKEELKNSIRKVGLCIITEFLFRYFDEIKFRNKRYFFSPEETAIIDIPNL
tara:strand:- start:2319 stop:6710 length:4392 start_codon:yes stop_codon:yes gene_type:complete